MEVLPDMKMSMLVFLLVVAMLFTLGHSTWHEGLMATGNWITAFLTGTP